ncbi:succinyl-diaminopimelate desuccinylase [Wolbachia pipientis]|uniref:Succinyl-diaminopimelate desuccinylase n=1 Tax=Wolbachia pipientis TaxID=955 RepID=A0A1E7QK86_WOLPI|nr:succinyl-diaminopimelate desuccinylase [Wolbachia pipientis]OEY86766.1 succinyl-diaminopimelate desuccinylase [Wolbachia pipientis]
MKIDPIELTKKLITFRSITPEDDGAIKYIASILKKSGFHCQILEYSNCRVKNLYAEYANGVPNLCFAGHVDVVHPGKLENWVSDPFKPEVRNGMLYGRGAADMKSGVAAFITAIVNSISNINGSITALITSAEESASEYGTQAILEWMNKRNKKIDYCIVCEPTSDEKLGDAIKIGRRGSITFKLICYGKQGHVAYPELADNAIYKLIDILNKIKSMTLDSGNKYFQPSHCEITTIDVGNSGNNVIPDLATAYFNIRYNNLHTSDSLYDLVNTICSNVTQDYKLLIHEDRKLFLSTLDRNTDIMLDAISKVTNVDAVFSTNGGTSDAAFIKDFCSVIEFGLINKTIHQVDECVLVDDIYKLTNIYEEFIKNYFYSDINKVDLISSIPNDPLLI